jgi:hypothetical protein
MTECVEAEKDSYQYGEAQAPSSIMIPPETQAVLKEAFELAKESERQVQMAQLNAEAKIARWQLALMSTMRDLDVPKCYAINFTNGTFEPIPAESATVQ